MIKFEDVVYFYHDGEVSESMEEVMDFFLVKFGVRVHALHKAKNNDGEFAVYGINKDDAKEFRRVLKLEHNLIYDFYECVNCENLQDVQSYAIQLNAEGF